MELTLFKEIISDLFYSSRPKNRNIQVITNQAGVNLFRRLRKNMCLYHRLKRNYARKRKL